jgi:hypothetical protein
VFTIHSFDSSSPCACFISLPIFLLSRPNLIDTGRRRKIRCIFSPDNPEVCTECFARGSRCIDQEHANPEVVVDHRKNLRERVSRLEALVDTLLDDKTVKSESRSQSISQADTSSPKAPTLYTKDTFPPTPLTSEGSATNFLPNNQRVPSNRGHHIPILSVFEDAVSPPIYFTCSTQTDHDSSMMRKNKPTPATQAARRPCPNPSPPSMIATPSPTGTKTT